MISLGILLTFLGMLPVVSLLALKYMGWYARLRRSLLWEVLGDQLLFHSVILVTIGCVMLSLGSGGSIVPSLH